MSLLRRECVNDWDKRDWLNVYRSRNRGRDRVMYLYECTISLSALKGNR